MKDFDIRRKFVGTTADGERVYLDARLISFTGSETQTVDHVKITEGQRFSISGQCGPEATGSFGQIVDDVRRITKPAEGLKLSDLADLVEIWETYHLNDMKALCEHQTVKWEYSRGYKSMDLAGIGPCPVTGYRPGSLWLYKPVPDSVLARVLEILS